MVHCVESQLKHELYGAGGGSATKNHPVASALACTPVVLWKSTKNLLVRHMLTPSDAVQAQKYNAVYEVGH